MIVRCLNRRIWIVLVVLAATGSPWNGSGLAADTPDGKIISEVVPIGNRIRKTEDIRAVMLCRPGTVYELATAAEDLRRLQATKWFDPRSIEIHTSVDPDGRVKVLVRLTELNNTVEDIQFRGAQHHSKKELQNLIGIQKGEPMNPLANKLGQQFILRKYREEGRTYASVELIEGKLVTDTRVIYQIVEGPVVRVAKIRFAGVNKATAKRLYEQFVNGQKFDTVIGEKFDSETLDLDRQELTKYYHALGFLGVQITPEIVNTAELGRVVIVYHIVEGQQYIVAGKQIDGNKSFDTATLEGLTELKLRKPYDGHIAEADIKRMRDYMSERGFAFDIELHFFEVPEQPGMVQVHYVVLNDNGTPKRVCRIRIPLAD